VDVTPDAEVCTRESSPTILEQWLSDNDEPVDGSGTKVVIENDGYSMSPYAESPLDPGLRPPCSPMPMTPSITVHDTSNPENEHTLLYELSTNGIPPGLKRLSPYIHANVDPHTLFADLTPVAEGQYGPVYAARSLYKESPTTTPSETVVAIKRISLSTQMHAVKIKQLETELSIMSELRHEHILSMEDLYLELQAEDAHGTLWVQMELMERSLADVLPLYDLYEGEGRLVHEGMIARFAQDVSGIK
jgi:hypothetical protein